MDSGEATRELSQDSRTMGKRLRDAIANAVELEAELADTRGRCVRDS